MDETGTLTDTYDYTAFGEFYAQTGTTPNTYLYTGQQYDEVTGLYSLRARYYNPSDGRFLSRDTYAYHYQNPIELNRYVYGMNNPATFYDPTGQIVGTTFLQRNTLITAEAAALLGKIETALYLVILAGLLLHLADLVNEYLDKHNPPIITFPPTLNFSPPRLSPPSLPPLIPPIIPPVHTPPFEWPDLDDWLPNPPFPFPDEGNFEVPPFEIPELDDLLDLPPFEWNQFEVPPFFPFADDQNSDDPYWIAREGGANSGFYNYHRNMPDNTLKRVIRKLQRNIEVHTNYLNDPISHVSEWETLRPEHQQNLLDHWAGEIERYEDEIAIIMGIFREERSNE